MPNAARWVLAVLVACVAVAPPVAYFRYQYIHAKRFREVTPERFYRSGQMTAAGLREIVAENGIKTVINLQHEEPDPLLLDRWMGKGVVRESELCRELGVKYLLLTPDVIPKNLPRGAVPPVVDDYLAVLDDPAAYPVLIHCKAGLHRTGRLTAIYRMEYMGWSRGEALRELRANGYGNFMASEADEFIIQFIKNYTPRKDRPQAARPATAPAPHPAPVAVPAAPPAPTGGPR
ncbi:protein phosphatase : Protein tyrosine/serine phosphatase OS=uncultured bacterium GN=ACD_20C00151G0006 PE=4 SV=1: Y_phosphatase2 [Gemmataceae bacterium]|nr:protein phosphatase : Protein tyrosine/serine phosphatase OS=uncultured bacterium GN=ACD_20C00151G0006 PE=4 SV=1: Y_phosphatase2 [Gemmataceae bacterium]VTT97438.1 protein phosphatase : Protein tyrosine/serine phosphatase OS=uncultured bacterium GN=ACD_20C00151G0006 PE=4 SV=1: Y_phosphatase2 [Gemmataceae bacterium]